MTRSRSCENHGAPPTPLLLSFWLSGSFSSTYPIINGTTTSIFLPCSFVAFIGFAELQYCSRALGLKRPDFGFIFQIKGERGPPH
jgi:hypothetical protein